MNPEATGSGFPAKEKLKSRKAIQFLFDHGSSMTQAPIKVIYLFKTGIGDPNALVKFSVSVPKKTTPKAYQRNRIKRLIREVYRLQKSPLLEVCQSRMISLDMMWIYMSKSEMDYPVFFSSASKIIQKTIALADKIP